MKRQSYNVVFSTAFFIVERITLLWNIEFVWKETYIGTSHDIQFKFGFCMFLKASPHGFRVVTNRQLKPVTIVTIFLNYNVSALTRILLYCWYLNPQILGFMINYAYELWHLIFPASVLLQDQNTHNHANNCVYEYNTVSAVVD